MTIKDKELIASRLLSVVGFKVNLLLNDNFNANKPTLQRKTKDDVHVLPKIYIFYFNQN